jgi:hypothetical protein
MVLLTPADGNPLPTVSAVAPAEPRGFHEINKDIRALFRREAQVESKQLRAQAAVEITRLYWQIRQDPRLAQSKTLQGYKAKLWSRLQRIKSDVRKDMARQSRNGAKDSQSDSRGPSQRPPDYFAQPGDARGGRAVADWGPGLVALIERTIAPDFWDTNGGPGAIVYYYPLRVLVVRATSEIHHQVGGELGALRAAGR